MGPPDLPAEFWHDPDLRAALAARDMGQVIRAYRNHPHHGRRGLTQEDVAAWAGIGQATLSQIENGHVVIDRMYKLIGWARLLGVPERYLWFTLPGTALAPVPTPADGATVEVVDRRALLVGGAAFTVGAAIAPTQVFATPRDVPPELAGYFADQLAAHVTTDMRLGARPLLRIVTSEYQVIREAAAAAPGQGVDMLAIGAPFARMVGWLYQDIGDLNHAWQWHSEALQLAHRTGDPNLVAYVLAGMAFLHREAGDGHAAVDLADAALATPGLPPTIRTFTLRQAAQARSLTGDRDGVDRALDEADDLTDSGTDDDRYRWGQPWWYGAPSGGSASTGSPATDSHRATCYMRLGLPEAADLLASVLDRWPTDARRDNGLAHARYARALFDLEGPDAALRPAQDAVACLQAAPSARMHSELAQLRDQATTRRDSRGGQELHDLLEAV